MPTPPHCPPERPSRRRRVLAVLGLAASMVLAGCATSRPAASHARAQAATTTVIEAAASIDAWGSILTQLGGSHVHATSVITNPDTDPHDYEPTPADGRTIAGARLFVENGIGYDDWAAKAIAAGADASQTVLDVGELVGVGAGGNPHRWYSPTDVATVAGAIAAALSRIDPANAGYFASRLTDFRTTALAAYDKEISLIRTRYAGTPIGASESIVSPLAQALDLSLVTPNRFLTAISEGTDPSAADKATIDRQIAEHQIAVYVYNSQNSTPDVAAQVSAARKQGIPVVAVTETLSPQGSTFQAWQTRQLTALAAALHQATGR